MSFWWRCFKNAQFSSFEIENFHLFQNGVNELTDVEIKQLVDAKHIPAYKLEGTLGDYERGVAIRRQIVLDKLSSATVELLDKLPYSNYEYLYVSWLFKWHCTQS